MSNKNKTIRARITSKDYKKFLERVENTNLSKSDFIRQSVLKSKVYDVDPFNKMFFELKREGSNLNQLIRQLNQYNPPTEQELKSELRELKTLYEQLKAILIGL
jgi:hypothetical protein